MAACKSATPPAEENLPTAEIAATVWVALISRHLPALVHHRGPVAAGLIVFGWPSWSRPLPRCVVRITV
jgi:hypothetical protein